MTISRKVQSLILDHDLTDGQAGRTNGSQRKGL